MLRGDISCLRNGIALPSGAALVDRFLLTRLSPQLEISLPDAEEKKRRHLALLLACFAFSVSPSCRYAFSIKSQFCRIKS